MARARNMKPGFYKNEDLAECSIWARYIYPGLWQLADREGRLEDRPKRIKGELLPYDSQEVEPLLAELAGRKFIHRYEVDGNRYIQIVAFLRHQNPHHREPASTIPAPKDCPGLYVHGINGEPQALGHTDDDEASGEPEASTPKVDIPRGQSRAESGNRNPDNGNRRKSRAFALPDWIDPEAWAGFEAMRARIRKPMTDRARELIVAELDKLRAQGHAANAVLDQSTRKSWQDVYPIKPNGIDAAAGGRQGALEQRNAEVAKAWVSGGEVRDANG